MKPFLTAVPMGRTCAPSDVANACCYVASDEASFITGIELEVSQITPDPAPSEHTNMLSPFANARGSG